MRRLRWQRSSCVAGPATCGSGEQCDQRHDSDRRRHSVGMGVGDVNAIRDREQHVAPNGVLGGCSGRAFSCVGTKAQQLVPHPDQHGCVRRRGHGAGRCCVGARRGEAVAALGIAAPRSALGSAAVPRGGEAPERRRLTVLRLPLRVPSYDIMPRQIGRTAALRKSHCPGIGRSY